ncbi:Fc.00g018630.m01.CDS01 [Cosmosporella sp. VM-42]
MADSGSKTRLRRTRTGCFKCRIRRRKCDEGKPTCRRCLEGGFECQYGTRLSFLEKNAKTVSSQDKNSRSLYSTLRFVEPESVSPKPGLRLQEDDTPPQGSDKASTLAVTEQTFSEESVVEQDSGFPDLISPGPEDFGSSTPQAQAQPQGFSHQPPDLHTPANYAIGNSPGNAAYETALTVLCSLGNDNFATSPGASQVAGSIGYFGSPTEPRRHSITTQSDVGNNWLAELYPNCAHLPQDRVVQLFRHYRYNIAPWLDIGDTGQTFGLLVSRIAMESIPVLESLLALSIASLEQHADPGHRDRRILPTDPNEPGMNVLYSLLVFTFVTIRRYVLAAPTSWQSPFKSVGFASLNSALFHEQYPTVSLAVSWLIVRLDVSVGLMTSSPVSIPDILPYGATAPLVELSRESLRFDREPLFMCARVLNHCFGQDMASSPSMQLGLGTTPNWKSLFESLNMWYSNRPRDFKPMLEIEENDQLFPLVLFTNGAAVLANQLYHASMLLLLQNRPRTLQNEHGRSIFMSPLWHAQRICGISLNNDSRTNWDFSLVASFYLAARRMTYEPQQQTILRGIDRIGSITGWNLNALAMQLVQEWQPG